MSEQGNNEEIFFDDDPWNRGVRAFNRARSAAGEAIARPFRAAGERLSPLQTFWQSLDPRLRVLWFIIPVLFVLLFPQETTSSPQAFTLIAIVLFILLGSSSGRVELLLLIFAVLVIINMGELPDAILEADPAAYPLDTGPELLLVAVPV
ncbi:MAG TPA: hypothetical protein VFY63_06100, partial [Pseudorhizobium sp.]|nr:hypothetical protein [Pseudorhizobium sp.]